MEWAEPEKKPMVSVVRSGRGVRPKVVSAASRGWLLEFPPPPFGPHPEISVQTRANESTRDNSFFIIILLTAFVGHRTASDFSGSLCMPLIIARKWNDINSQF